MVASKTRNITSGTTRRKKSSKGKFNTAVICFMFFLIFLLFITVGFYLFSDNKNYKNIFLDFGNEDSGSLIENDEIIYQNSAKLNQKHELDSVDKPAFKNDASRKDKENFHAPDYKKRDKDYLNRVIHSR